MKLICCCLLLIISVASAQPPTALPTDPKTILRVLRGANGLSLEPSVPWHLRLSWDEFDQDGDNVHAGTVEEFYVSPHRYRLVFAGDVFNQVEIATDAGLFMPDQWPPVRPLQALEFIATPLRRLDDEPKDVRFETLTRQFGTISLSCTKSLPPGYIEISSPSYCYTPGSTQLRFSRAPALDSILYNKLIVFQNRFVAQQIDASIGDRKVLQVRIDKLEALPDPDASLFLPDPGLAPLSGRIKVPGSLLVVDKRGQLEPAPGQSGKATVHFVVGKDGRVIETQAVSGPADIQKVALRAMQQYRFRPFLVLGQPIEVEATMEFSIN